MPRSSADPPKSAGEVNVYWRRRVIALAAGIGLLGLVTWTVNGVLGGGTRQASDLSQASRQHGSHHSAQPAPGTTSSPTPASTAGHASATPSATGKPGPSPSSSAKRGASASTRAPSAGQRGRKAHGPGACPHAALVLSLFSARYSYPAHARPEFTVDVVSTAPGRCTADLGPAHVHVVIRAGGKNPGLGLRGLRPARCPGDRAGPGRARRGPDLLEPADLGRGLPVPAPGRPAWDLHRHRLQREPEQPHHDLRAEGTRNRGP